MAVELPKAIAEYFAADKQQPAEAVSHCFTEDAVVRDEGITNAGRSAIRQWKADTSQKYTYTSEPVAIAREGDRTIVTSHLVGNFPGSPLDLRYVFVLEGEKIAALEIAP
ncbi:nuclear transport factor 2 family protein [Rhodopseudomonas telluris]|uniref:Nuclear transport factor 2 family protein n=1 Tax=Rhodopseudomonas telluris TaxID=644215 RepID=A0ABV6EW88_9BRAD